MAMMGSTSTNTKLRGDDTSFVLGRCTFIVILDINRLNPQDSPFIDIV